MDTQDPRAPQAGRDAVIRRRLDLMARFLDARWRVPGTRIRFGGDAVMSLLPGVGPVVGACASGYIVWQARRLGVPPATLLRMLGNLGLDAAISAVPVAGWIGDVAFRANLRNIALIRQHLDGLPRGAG
jgi:hypothetical protein